LGLIEVGRSIAIFVVAAVAEIGGAYLIWQWLRGSQPLFFALAGAALLFAYALLQTAQPFSFGRAFAGYGGIFVATATLWGWWIDGRVPDSWDWVGLAICLIGVSVILWMPRR
jgi:small multidrug resistance family-3 protein